MSDGGGTEDGWVQVRIPEHRVDQARHLVQLIAREPFRRRSWAELGYFLVSSALAGVAVFVLGILGFAGLVLTVVFVGILILAGGLRIARTLGGWQRRLAVRLLAEDIPDPGDLVVRPGFFGWIRASLGDRAAWGAVGYFAAKVPLTLFGAWFALSIWFEGLFDIASPITGGGVPRFGVFGHLLGPGYDGGPPGGFARHVGVFVIGVVLLFAAPWATRFVVFLDRRMMHFMLGPDAATSRVRTLEESRSKTLDAAAQTLQRIERDLHDGTQAQLVAMAMQLGQAKEKLDHLGGGDGQIADLDAIRRLVDDAHRGAKGAIADLRNLARGIHPPVLDTGLENALTTLAARSTVTTEVTVAIRDRPSPAVEAICYFCAAELLANVVQHARASWASLSCVQHGPWLRIVVRDDGQGGAAINRIGSSSSGLAGLADRVGAVDGSLSIASPPGGPTAVTVDLPSRT